MRRRGFRGFLCKFCRARWTGVRGFGGEGSGRILEAEIGIIFLSRICSGGCSWHQSVLSAISSISHYSTIPHS